MRRKILSLTFMLCLLFSTPVSASVISSGALTTIEGYAFTFNPGTRYANIVIPNTVTVIGSDAFYYVDHIEYHGSASGAPWRACSMN